MAISIRKIKSGPLFRSFELNRAEIDQEKRMVPLSFSSEEPVERWFGMEILDHVKGSVRLGRMQGGAALLVDHNPSDHVGVVEDVSIGSDRKGHAVVRFGKSARAEEIFQDVSDGIRKHVSVGYRVHEMKLEKSGDKTVDSYRVTDWEPFEVSIVSIPADVSVGVGRSAAAGEEHEITIKEEQTMNRCKHCGTEHADGAVCQCAGARSERAGSQVDVAAIERKADERAMKRVGDIMTLAETHKCQELGRKAIQEGKSVDEFRDMVLRERYNAKPIETPDPSIGLTDKEKRQYSIVRGIMALAAGSWKGAELERDASEAVAKRMGKSPQGFFVPYDVMAEQRDLTTGVATAGGYLVPTQMLSIIELLRNKMKIKELGATILGGLQGDIAIPKQTGGATAYWVAENGAPTESQQTLGQLAMRPKTVGAYTDISRRLLMQASLDVEGFVRNDLATVLALAIDLAAINGSGVEGQPLGILKTTGIGDVAGGTNGAAPTYAHMVALETAVADANADAGSLAYLTNSKVRGKLKQTQRFTSTDTPVWTDGGQPGIGMVNGYKAAVSNQVPKTLTKGSASGICSAMIYGNFADLVVAEWGSLDILVDPYTGGAAGTVRVRVLEDVDVAVRHVESFAAMQDVLTT